MSYNALTISKQLKEVLSMTCSFCGSTLDDNEVECPYCGHKTANAAPAEEAKASAAPEGRPERVRTPQDAEKKSRFTTIGDNIGSKFSQGVNKVSGAKNSQAAKSAGAIKSAGGKMNPTGIMLIGLVACLLLSMIAIISVAGMKKNLETMNQDMLSLFYQMQNSVDKVQTKVDQLEKTLGNVSTTISESETSRYITITKQPTSTPTYVGRGSETDTTQNVPVFTVTATGVNLSFTWQRYDETSSQWVNLGFDGNSNNETYGLHVYTDAEKGYSELAAHDLKREAYGTYRCQISDANGMKLTDSVNITEKQKGE